MIKASATDIDISFDIVDVDEHEEIINFTIKIEFSPFLQKAIYQVRKAYIDKNELNKFEEELTSSDTAELNDVNGYTIIRLQRTNDGNIIEVQPLSDEVASDYDRLNITMYADVALMDKLSAAFTKYPKWW